MLCKKCLYAGVTGKLGAKRHEPYFHVHVGMAELIYLLQLFGNLRVGRTLQICRPVALVGLFTLIDETAAGERSALPSALAAAEIIVIEIVDSAGAVERFALVKFVVFAVTIGFIEGFPLEAFPTAASRADAAGLEILIDVEPFLRAYFFLLVLLAKAVEEAADA